ncbi:hypothetical protein [Nonomuraea sp. CA-141351]|uniref:hypothetical protein n=1 Tax=Nonomuraea sp. CA-141351 TaxID=3239996 RepID=UPI003D8B25A5
MMVDALGRPWIFLVNVPVSILVMAVGLRALRGVMIVAPLLSQRRERRYYGSRRYDVGVRPEDRLPAEDHDAGANKNGTALTYEGPAIADLVSKTSPNGNGNQWTDNCQPTPRVGWCGPVACHRRSGVVVFVVLLQVE